MREGNLKAAIPKTLIKDLLATLQRRRTVPRSDAENVRNGRAEVGIKSYMGARTEIVPNARETGDFKRRFG